MRSAIPTQIRQFIAITILVVVPDLACMATPGGADEAVVWSTGIGR
jgi:hypothetical protein